MNNNCNYIKTSDNETKELLLKEGFELLSEINGICTFLNKPSNKSFDNNSAKNTVFTNKLFL